VTAGCRTVKDAHDCADAAGLPVTLRATTQLESLKEGMTQSDFSRLVEIAQPAAWFRGVGRRQVGKYSALPHGSAAPQVFGKGRSC